VDSGYTTKELVTEEVRTKTLLRKRGVRNKVYGQVISIGTSPQELSGLTKRLTET